VLSQGGPRDAAVNLGRLRVEVYSGIARFLCHSTAFLYRSTSVTVQMLKLLKVGYTLIFTAVTQNHDDSRKSQYMTGKTNDRYYRRYQKSAHLHR